MTSGHSAHRGPANGCPTAVGYGGYTRTLRVTAAVGAMAAAMAGKVLPLASCGATGCVGRHVHHWTMWTSASSLPHSTGVKRAKIAAGRWGSSSTTCHSHGKLQEHVDEVVAGRQRVHHDEACAQRRTHAEV